MSKKHNSSPKQNLDTKAHVSNSVYYMSEAFNQLRKELYENWREDPTEDLIGDRSLWYYSGLMVTFPQAFVEMMSLELGLNIMFDSGKEEEICFEILNALRKKRGAFPFVSLTQQ